MIRALHLEKNHMEQTYVVQADGLANKIRTIERVIGAAVTTVDRSSRKGRG